MHASALARLPLHGGGDWPSLDRLAVGLLAGLLLGLPLSVAAAPAETATAEPAATAAATPGADDPPTLPAATAPAPTTSGAIEALLATETEEDGYAEQRRCIDSTRIHRTEIIGESFIVFHVRPKSIWVNRLPGTCDGLKPTSVLVTESNERRLCELDLMQPYNPGIGSGGVSCRLGRFEEITQEQLDAIKAQYAQE